MPKSALVLIVLVLILIGLSVFLVGYLWLKPDLPLRADLSSLARFYGSAGPASSLPPASLLQRLSYSAVTAPALSSSGQEIVFFEKSSGKILAVDRRNGEMRVISGENRSRLNNAFWSPAGEEVIFSQAGRYFYYSLLRPQVVPLHPFLSSPVWSKNGQRVAYLFFNRESERGEISLANPDGSDFKSLLPTRLTAISLFWPQDNLLSLVSQNDNRQGDDLYLWEISSGKLTGLLTNQRELQVNWSPSGKKAAISFLKDGGKLAAQVFELSSERTQFLSRSVSVSQCAWSLNELFLFCGVENAGVSQGGVFRFLTATGQAELIFSPSPEEPLQLQEPFLSPTEEQLFFINAYDQNLYRLSLTK